MDSEAPLVYSLDGLLAILRLSDRFIIPSGVDFACQQLESRQDFTPALQIRLSISLDLPRSANWFKTAVTALLMHRPALILTSVERRTIGVDLYEELVMLRKRLGYLLCDDSVAPSFAIPVDHRLVKQEVETLYLRFITHGSFSKPANVTMDAVDM